MNKQPELTDKLFVYGTLKRGFSRNSVLKDAEFLGNAKLYFNYFRMIDCGFFPALVKVDPRFSRKRYEISGELYRITPEILVETDIIEGYPSLYDRTEEIVTRVHPTDKTIDHFDMDWAWVYYWNRPDQEYETIESGVWTKGLNYASNLQ